MPNCKICGQPVTCGPVVHDGCYTEMAASLAQLRADLVRVKRERDAAVAAVGRMAEYIVVYGRVDYWLCDDIPNELHLKHQPKDDGNYENGPCIECVKEYYLRGPQKEGMSNAITELHH